MACAIYYAARWFVVHVVGKTTDHCIFEEKKNKERKLDQA